MTGQDEAKIRSWLGDLHRRDEEQQNQINELLGFVKDLQKELDKYKKAEKKATVVEKTEVK